MIRVAFILGHFAQGWMGGVNYFRNLIHAVRSVPKPLLEPVLIVPPGTPQALLQDFPEVEIRRTRLLDRTGRGVRRAAARWLQRDALMEQFLRQHRVDVLSHAEDLGRRSSLVQTGWIGDFQHLRMPEFFDARELAARDQQFRSIADTSRLVLVSSEDARRDLERFAPEAVAKCRVLHFTSGYGEAPHPIALSSLEAKYGFSGPYFHLPNQFWAHKNHRVVLDALSVLRARGTPAQVISTGSTQDYRNPDYFGGLMRHAEALRLGDAFKVLGMVPYPDLCALMRHSVAVVNPSHFEGWSTTVEEAKSFGKRVILSDLPVHREQAPERGVYFSADDARALADAMEQALASHSHAEESEHQEAARAALPGRFQAFGARYQSIIAELGA